MLNKTSIYFILLHVFIITYLIVTVVGASDDVMFVMHSLAPFMVILTLYSVLKAFRRSVNIKEHKTT